MKKVLVDSNIVAPGYMIGCTVVDPERDIISDESDPTVLYVGDTLHVVFVDEPYETEGVVIDIIEDSEGSLFILDVDYDSCTLIDENE